MPSGYCLALAFCPGDRHLAAATKGGAVELYSLATGERTESVAAHTGEVWALVLAPDQRSYWPADSIIDLLEENSVLLENVLLEMLCNYYQGHWHC